MKGFRFYEELYFKNRKGENSQGNVIALFVPEQRCPDGTYECLLSLFNTPNSLVCNSAVSPGYLETDTRLVSEAKARSIHPKLFEYLD